MSYQNNKDFAPIPIRDDEIGKMVVNASYTVHKQLGPGLLESIYEVCLCHELQKRGELVSRQVSIPIVYDGHQFDEGLRLDVLVDERVILELKSVEELLPVHYAQVLSYLRMTGKRLGYLINFNVPKIKDGIHRLVVYRADFFSLVPLVP